MKYHRIHLRLKIVFLGFVFVLFFSCSKKNTPTPTKTKTKTELLTAADWHQSKGEFGSSINDLVELPLIQQNTPLNFRFSSSATDTGSFISNTGNGTWAMTNNETLLSVNFSKDDAAGISASRTVLQITFNSDGTLTWLFPLKQSAYGYVKSDGSVIYYSEARQTYIHL